MKIPATLLCLSFVFSMHAKEHDSIVYRGYVLTKENYIVMPCIKNAKVIAKYNKQVIGITTSNQFGYFEMKLPKIDTFDVEVSARDQPRITFDSICPYLVYKTPSGFFDSYACRIVLINQTIITDTFKLNSPLYCDFGLKFFDKAKAFDESIACNCLMKQFQRIDTNVVTPKIDLMYYYSSEQEKSYNYQKAMTLKLKLSSEYFIPEKYLFIYESFYQPKNTDNAYENEEISIKTSLVWK